MTKNKLAPVTPGEILQEEFLSPMGISQSQLARDIDVPQRRINEIVNGKRSVTPDTAMRLAVYFGTSPEFWMNLQTVYDLKILSEKKQEIYDNLPHASEAA
jgi:addiction module HigA family antidote